MSKDIEYDRYCFGRYNKVMIQDNYKLSGKICFYAFSKIPDHLDFTVAIWKIKTLKHGTP